MRKQPLKLVSLLLMGCFALTLLSFIYFTERENHPSSAANTECCGTEENTKNGEFLSETVFRQFLMAVFTK